MEKIKDVHTEHCCREHGCKYGDGGNCTVMSGQKTQSFACEVCDWRATQTDWIGPVVRDFFGEALQPVIVDALIDALVKKAQEVL